MTANAGIFTDPWDGEAGASEAHPAQGSGSAPYVSLRFAWRACRRRWRLCLAIALGCALLGAIAHLAVAPAYSSSSDVYLAEPPAATPSQAMANDVAFLQTRAVASRAIHALHLHVRTSALLASYTGVAQSDAILSITVGAPTPAMARARNHALDAAFLSLRADEFRLQTHAAVTVLRAQLSTLNRRIRTLNLAITLASSEAGAAARSLPNLVAQRNNEGSQVLQVQNTIQQDLVALGTLTNGSSVLDPPALIRQSRYNAMFIDALSGLAAGMAIAFGSVGIAALVSDRPRTREDVGTLLGAPIELSLGRQRRRRSFHRQRLEQLLEHPAPSVLMIERRLKAHAQASPDLTLGIVTIGADDLAAHAVLRLAMSLLAEGTRVVLADDVESHPLARLLPGPHVPGELHEVGVHGHVLHFFLGTADPVDMAQQRIPEGAGVVLVLTEPNPEVGATHLAAWVSHAVVLVGREHASTARLAMTAELLHREELAIRSAILIGVLPDDTSLGVVRRRLGALDPRRLATFETAPS